MYPIILQGDIRLHKPLRSDRSPICPSNGRGSEDAKELLTGGRAVRNQQLVRLFFLMGNQGES